MSLSQQPPGPRYGPPEPPLPAPYGTAPTTTAAPAPTAPAPTAPAPARSTPPPPSIRPLVALRVIGVAGALLLVLGCTSSVVSQFFRRTTQQTLAPDAAVTKVVIDDGDGDLFLHAGVAGQPLKVVAREHRSFSRPRTTWATSNGVFTVTGRCTGSWWFNGDCSIDLDVTLPPGTALDVTTGYGDVRLDGITGTVAADSGNGDITMARMASPNVQATTGNGDIKIISSAATSITARTGNGDLTLIVPDGATYKVQADTGNGDPVIDFVSDPASTHVLDAHTDNGDLTITNPAGRRAGQGPRPVQPSPPDAP